MTPKTTCQILLALGSALALAAPAYATDEVEIRKVNSTELSYERVQRTSDPMIDFERRRLVFGAHHLGRLPRPPWEVFQRVVESEGYGSRNRSPFRVSSGLHRFGDSREGSDRGQSGAKQRHRFPGHWTSFTGEWTWPDGRKLTEEEYDSYISRVRSGDPIDVKANPTGGGDVVAWKVSLVRDGSVLATTRSYLWRD